MNRGVSSNGRRRPRGLVCAVAVIAGLLGGGVGPAEAGWTNIGPDGENVIIYTLALDPTTPTTVYAGLWDGVFKSTDGGTSWSPATTGLTCGTSSCEVTALALDPTTPTTLYAGTSSDGVFKSTDGGGSWSPVNTGLINLTVTALALDPTTPTTLYAGTSSDGVFKSTDGGGSWSPVNTGLTCGTSTCEVTTLALDPTTPTTLRGDVE